MKKRLYNENDSRWNDVGSALGYRIEKFVMTEMDKLIAEGYCIRDIESVAHSSVNMAALTRLLDSR